MSAAWNVYREEFMEKYLDIFSNMKLRMGYGQNGNVNGIGLYELQGSYANAGNYNGVYGLLIDDIAYPGLRWEKNNFV